LPTPSFDDLRLYLLLTRDLCRGDPLELLEVALSSGVDLVQLREKPFGADSQAWIESVANLAHKHGVPIVINDRLDLARHAGCCGVHMGQEDLAAYPECSLAQRDFALGLSTHDPTEMTRALSESPDYVGVGPCFATETKGYTQGLGPGELEALLELSPVPAYGIGGINPGNLPQLLDRGLRHIAVSSCILGSPDPARTTAELRRLLDAC
jgi:thiamine-phosphate pyrophosphorylase